MDFDPSACSVSLATAQSSPNFDHLNLKCCSSSADLAPVMEPVAMAKDLNVSVDHLHLTAEVAECVPHTHTHTGFLHSSVSEGQNSQMGNALFSTAASESWRKRRRKRRSHLDVQPSIKHKILL